MSFLSLPTEILPLIFSQLPLGDICKLCLVCHRFREACKSQDIWKELYTQDWVVGGKVSSSVDYMLEEYRLGWKERYKYQLKKNKEMIAFIYSIIYHDTKAKANLVHVYRAFTTTKQMINIIMHCLHQEGWSKTATVLRYLSILNQLIDRWSSSDDFLKDYLFQILDAEVIPHFPPIGNGIKRSLQRQLETTRKKASLSPIGNFEIPIRDHVVLSATQVAHQIALYIQKPYLEIEIHELFCLRWIKAPQEAPNVIEYLKREEWVFKWTENLIQSEENKKKVITKLLAIAMSLHDIGCYAGLYPVLKSLEPFSLSDVELRDNLDANQNLQMLRDFMSSDNNYARHRDVINNPPFPEALPWLGIFLKDFSDIEEQFPFDPTLTKPIINLQKVSLLHKNVYNVQQFCQHQYQFPMYLLLD